MPVLRHLIAVALVPLVAGCGAAAPFHPATPGEPTAAGSPLGPSYILVALPNNDDSLLGRVLLDVPENGRSLEEVSRPNECADKLTPKKDGPIASTFEDAQELAAGGKARAALGAFGFEGDAQTATHFYYKLDVNRRVAQTDTSEYVACCKDKGTCGYGFISALIFGDGQYATATENSADASIDIPVAGGAGGFVKAKILHKQNVHGYLAALVTITDPAKSKAISVMGDPAAAGIALTEQSLPDQVKARFELQKIRLAAQGSGPQEFAYAFQDGNGTFTENEFVRRYASLTGSSDLDGANRHRNAGAGGGLTVLGLAGIGASVPIFIASGSQSCNCSVAALGGTVVAGGGVTALVFGIIDLANGDGDATEHSITKFDADLYVAKYNRALLRKTIQETKERMQQLSGRNDAPRFTISPMISPGFTGIVGTF